MDAYHLELDQDLINLAKSIQEASCKKEELVGGQKKIDKNGNGKLDADDFKKLRKEDTVEEGIEAFGLKATDAQRKKAKEDGAKFTAAALAKREKVKEEVELTLEDYTLEELEDYMMSEEFDQLDEISGKVLGSYIQKARKEIKDKGAHAHELENDPKVKALQAKVSDYHKRREYTKSGENRHHKAIDNARDAQVARKKKLDPEYPKSVSTHKRRTGVEKATHKLTAGKLTNEDVESIDELSKGTLGSYVNKAAKEARINGMISRDFENSAERKRNPGMKAAASSLKDKYQKKAWKREDGIKTAVGKLTKEQVEEIELLVTKHGLSEAVIEESAELSRGAKNALAQAANHKSGSEEYHKWMAVHHSHAARSGKQADQAHHSIEAEHHFNHVPADSKSGEDFHNGDSHHWNA